MFALSLLLAGCCRASAPAGEEVRLPLVMYHHILADKAGCGDYVITPEMLESDLIYLRDRGYTAVGVEDVLRWLDGEGELPDKPFMLTFDDGHESFACYVLPLLEKYDMKAVQAPVGAWADKYTEDPDDDPAYAYMSWARIAEIAASGRVEIADHSYDMHLTEPRYGLKKKKGEDEAAYEAALTADLEKAEAKLAAACGYVPTVYAYPYGAYCPEAKRILAERGYRIVFTCVEQVNVIKRGAAEPLELGRFNRAYRLDREKFFSAFE